MRKAKYFTTIDAKAGFFQIKCDEQTKEYLAFTDGVRKFTWNYMPMGVKNAPMVFSRIMYQVLGEFGDFVITYIDDICIYSNTLEEHIEHIKKVMDALNKVNMKINPEKCVWIAEKIKLLGFIISAKGIEMDGSKVAAMRDKLPPRNIKGLQTFLGNCIYYKKGIRNYSDTVEPLLKLLRKDTVWNWDDDCQKSFDYLKNCFITFPILRQPEDDREFFLYTDASNFAVGAVLCQKDDDGTEYVIAYASKSFKQHERHMGISEKEMAGVVFGVNEFRHYIFGVKFTIVTDHSALKYLMSIKNPEGKLARWSNNLSKYTFDIIHRKGSSHANADYISRPETTYFLNKLVNNEHLYYSNENDDNNDEDLSLKNFDPYDDEPLLYYLKYKKHQDGIPKKQVKRIEKLKNYDFKDGRITIVRNKQLLIYPPKEERDEIIDKFHAASAHFGVDSTLNRIKEKYFWTKMYNDVENYKKRCEKCIRNDHHLIENHPALANKITKINDEISIDFSWGYDVDSDGYNGVMFIQEELSKHVKIYKMKSKSEDEIAKRYMEYCCDFGPPKKVRSDNEAGLISALQKLKNIVGLEWHKTVAAYSPSHNGLIERFVGTFSTTIRKLSENNQTKWSDWLSFIELAYNTRVHSTTKLTPYECIFGVKCNHFEDWTEKEGENENEALKNRVFEIKNLEKIREKAIQNIEKQQEKQKDNQNKRTKRIRTEFLQNGTIVYRKNEGIISKLSPRWIGPYTVFDHDNRGNYFLKDSIGEGNSQKYPLEKLKIVPNEVLKDNLKEIKKILEHKKILNTYQYLVEWIDGTQDWINEDDFQTIDVINDYWKFKETGIEKKTRGRPRKVNLIEKVFFSLLCLLLISNTTEFDSETHTKFCTTNQRMKIVDFHKLCSLKMDKANLFTELKDKKDFIILNKLHHEVSGPGYKCQVETYELNCSVSFFGVKTCLKSDWRNIKLNKEDCSQMVKTKKCKIERNEFIYQKNMTCNENGCNLEDYPVQKFNWMETNILHGYKCSWMKIGLLGTNKTSPLFYENNCIASKLECDLGKSILIWNQDIFHDCPYEELKVKGKYKYDENFLINEESDILLQPTKKITACGISLYETNEGLTILEANPTSRTKLINYKVKMGNSENLIDKLILSNMDFGRFGETSLMKFIDAQVCTIFGMSLKLFSKMNNEFLKIFNNKGEVAILYARNSLIYIPECVIISELKVIHDGKICFKEIHVSFKHNNKTMKGFLDSDLIIKLVGTEINCEINSDAIRATESSDREKSIIQRIGTEIVVKKESEFDLQNLNILTFNITKLNVHHPEAILYGSDELKEIYEIKEKEGEEFYFVEPKHDDVSKTNIKKWISNIKDTLLKPFEIIYNYIYMMVCIIISIGILYLITKYGLRFYIHKRISNITNTNNNNLLMDIDPRIRRLL
jgi:hypothetical protein